MSAFNPRQIQFGVKGGNHSGVAPCVKDARRSMWGIDPTATTGRGWPPVFLVVPTILKHEHGVFEAWHFLFSILPGARQPRSSYKVRAPSMASKPLVCEMTSNRTSGTSLAISMTKSKSRYFSERR